LLELMDRLALCVSGRVRARGRAKLTTLLCGLGPLGRSWEIDGSPKNVFDDAECFNVFLFFSFARWVPIRV
jgi:hypothetical protein